MESNFKKAKEALLTGNYTCVLVNGEQSFTSEKRGVSPLVEWLESGVDFSGFSAADKVIGKAAAFIYVLLGIKQIHAIVISEPAKKVFLQFGVEFTFENCVPAIKNRTNTDLCPMEKATAEVSTPEEALIKVKNTIKKLNKT